MRLRAKDIQLTVFHTVEDLEANGWMDDPVAKEDERYYHARDLDPVLSQLGIPLESGRSFRDAKQAEDFLNMDNVHTVRCSVRVV